MERNYVVVCNRHKGIGGSLLFWGCLTKDEAKRSFGGYTSDFNGCEKYTLEEVEQSGYNFPVFGLEVGSDNYKGFDDFAIKIDDLKILRYRAMMIYYR